jgi:hypothetical protein
MKVKPMINGIEVKVGQVWEDHYGGKIRVEAIKDSGEILDDKWYSYTSTGKPRNCYGAPYSLKCLMYDAQAEVKPKATFTESEINAKINQVIKYFDWQKASSVYTALNWTWYEIEGVPTVGDLVVKAMEYMKQAVQIAVNNQEEGYVSSGGLIGRAYITDGKLAVSLEMQVTEASSGY